MPLSNSGAEPTEDSDISELKSGADVEHAKFGRGKIISIEGSGPNMKATVFFNSVGNKNLLLRFAKLKIV
jgi:DNA helicase-2/ATP-dependent DNA helicase PcrA